MKDNGIAASLLKGSQEIDRMRIEIHQLVSMVLGFIGKSYSPDVKEEYYLGNGSWVIRTFLVPVSQVRTQSVFNVTCRSLCDGKWLSVYSNSGGPEEDSVFLGAGAINFVYDLLDSLIEGVIEKFPEVEKNWEFLIKASKRSRG